jgi:hypothetical protein
MRIFTSMCVVSLLAIGTARAQFPNPYGGAYPGGYPSGGSGGYGTSNGFPGLYGGGLSPYLNLFGRGISPSAAYYNFVRPYTGGTFGNAYTQGAANFTGRTPFFPFQIPVYADDDVDIQRQIKGRVDENGQQKVDMPPAGHPSGFMNTEGFFGSPNGVQGFGAGRRSQVGVPPRR